eukprot:GILI01001414.1.p1 GENE.GILI01001414.1~~GILI01001414.1.p1  ORF type:complete len:236 (-),score=70.34 GILI01001414.1:428-1054(-)
MTWFGGCHQISGIDASIPNNLDFLGVVAVAYSIWPYVWFALMGLWLIVGRTTRGLLMVLLLAFVTLFNELVLKNIFVQRRPVLSCLESYGMPSGHSANAGVSFTIIFLELLFNYRSSDVVKRILYCFATVLAFLPVPWSRVYLNDHSFEQVTAGFITGFGFGVLMFLLLKYYLADYRLDLLCQWKPLKKINFKNDYPNKTAVLTNLLS